MRVFLILGFCVIASLSAQATNHCLLSANFYTHEKQTFEIDCPRDQATEDSFHAQKFKTLAEAIDYVSDKGYEIQVMAPHDISHAVHNFIMGYSLIFRKADYTKLKTNPEE